MSNPYPHHILKVNLSFITAAREKACLTHDQMAHALGITTPWYRDIEAYEEDLPLSLDLIQLYKLISALNLDTRELLAYRDERSLPDTNIQTYEQLRLLILASSAGQQGTLSDLEKRVGWGMVWLQEPNPNLDNACLNLLVDIAQVVPFDWHTLIQARARACALS
jgi:transcriptional regulator with XRE-family HTH domain